jgi:thiamine transport system ATP-binding protein
MLDLQNLKIRQGSFQLTASLCGLDAKIYAIMGPSGAGKSTFLSALAGFLPVSSGAVLWNGQNITGLRPAQRPMAMLFQDNNLFPHLSAKRNVALALTQRRYLSSIRQEQVKAALSRVGLGGFEASKPGELSGGQQSRVALARVLLQDKPILLLDEPFTALGPALKNEMLDLLQTLAQERQATVLMVTHDPNDALRIADETLLLSDQVLSPPQPTTQVMASPPKALAAYLGLD